jgi:hypothetical protein
MSNQEPVSLQGFPQHVVGLRTAREMVKGQVATDIEYDALQQEKERFESHWTESRNKFASLDDRATVEPSDLFDYLAAYAVNQFDSSYFDFFSSTDFVNGVPPSREYYVNCIRAYQDCKAMKMTPRVRALYDELHKRAEGQSHLAQSTLEGAGLFNANGMVVPWSTEDEAQASNAFLLECVVVLNEKKLLDEFEPYVEANTLQPEAKATQNGAPWKRRFKELFS